MLIGVKYCRFLLSKLGTLLILALSTQPGTMVPVSEEIEVLCDLKQFHIISLLDLTHIYISSKNNSNGSASVYFPTFQHCEIYMSDVRYITCTSHHKLSRKLRISQRNCPQISLQHFLSERPSLGKSIKQG